MAIINIETATPVCSVALSENEDVLFEKRSLEGLSHASHLGVFVEETIREAVRQNVEIQAVAVSCGPGSYTGLRIGVSMAKGVCFGQNVPLLSIPTLKILALKAIKKVAGEHGPEALFYAMLDARRMEVYSAIYDTSLCQVRNTKAEIITEETYAQLPEKQKVYFFGNGAEKCKNMRNAKKVTFIDEIVPLAKDMALLSGNALATKKFEDVAYFEPVYLKDFTATVSKNKVLPGL